MKILYDFQSFSVSKFNGVSNYFTSLFPHLIEEGHEITIPFIYTDCEDLLKLKLRRHIKSPEFIDQRICAKIRMKLGKWQSISHLKYSDYDIAHSTQYDPYLFEYTEKPVVVTIHDMIQEIFNIIPRDIRNKKESIEKASKIIAISENTKKDILRFYPNISPDKIEVIYHGYNTIEMDDIPNKFGSYILYVGQRGSYKNFKLFFKAISPLLAKDHTLNLVCTGKPFNDEENRMIEEAGIKNQCYSSFFPASHLGSLYRNALCFVYPSMYEGFGLPILDAFHFGCPVCLSNASCFPEIAGNAGLYFDPESQESIFEAVSNMVYNKNCRDEYRLLGEQRASMFTWEKSAAAHSKLYNSL